MKKDGTMNTNVVSVVARALPLESVLAIIALLIVLVAIGREGSEESR